MATTTGNEGMEKPPEQMKHVDLQKDSITPEQRAHMEKMEKHIQQQARFHEESRKEECRRCNWPWSSSRRNLYPSHDDVPHATHWHCDMYNVCLIIECNDVCYVVLIVSLYML